MNVREGFDKWWENNKDWCREEDKSKYSCAYAGGANDTMARSIVDMIEEGQSLCSCQAETTPSVPTPQGPIGSSETGAWG